MGTEFPAAGVYCEVSSCSVTARSLELGISPSQGVFICFYFFYSGFSLSTLVLLLSAQSLVIPFLSAPSGFFFNLFLFQLTSSLVYITLSILHNVQVSTASTSSCQIRALSLHAVWIRVILDTQTLHANLHASMDMANTQSRTNSSDSGGNQRLSHFLLHQWHPSSPWSWDSESMKEAQGLCLLNPPEWTLWQAISPTVCRICKHTVDLCPWQLCWVK